MSILTTFTNFILRIKQKTDVKNIAVYKQEDNTEVFINCKYIDGSADDDLKFMEHPLENGATIVDHVIDDPKTVHTKLIVADDDDDSLNEILELYKNRTPLIVKIKNELFKNVCISAKPVKAEVQYYDKSIYELTYKEVIEAQTVYVKMSVPQVAQKKNASTIKTGHKQAQVPKKPKQSILAKIKKRIK